jgi:hypothetical protein
MNFKKTCMDKLKDTELPDSIKLQMSDFLDELEEAYRTKNSGGDFKKYATEVMNQRLEAIKGAKIEVYNNKIKASKRRAHMKTGVDALSPQMGKLKAAAEAFKSFFRGSNNAFFGSGASVESKQRALRQGYLSHIVKLNNTEVDGLNLGELARNKTIDEDVTRELFELQSGRQGGITGNKAAIETAKIYAQLNEFDLKAKQDAGVPVLAREAYVRQGVYVRERVKQVGKEEFVNFFKERIDTQKSFLLSKKDIDESLGKMYEDILEGKNLNHLDVLEDGYEDTFGGKLTSKLGNKFTKRRQVVFKDGQAMFEAFEKFGTESLYDSMVRRSEQSSKALGLISILGTNPDRSFERMKNDFIKEFGEDAWKEADNNAGASQLLKEAKGYTYADTPLNRATEAVVGFEVGSKLGVAALSSPSDLAFAAAGLKSFDGTGLVDGTGKLVSTFLSLLPKEARKEAGEAIGLMSDAEIEFINRDLTTGGVKKDSFANRFAAFTMKWSGFDLQSETSRKASGVVFLNSVAKNVERGFENMSQQTKDHLARFKIDQSDVVLMRGAVEEYKIGGNNHRLVTPDSLKAHLDSLPTKDLEAMAELKGYGANVDKFKRETVNKLRELTLDFISMAAPEPGMSERAGLRLGTDPNTVAGAAVRAVMLFRSYGFAAYRNISRNALSLPATSKGTLLQSLEPGKGGLSAVAGLGAYLWGLGMMSTVARDAVKGEKRFDNPEGMKRIALEAFANAIPVLGDASLALIDRADPKGASVAKFFGGPVVADAMDLAGTLYSASNQVAQGDFGAATSKAGTFAIKKAVPNLPGVAALKTGLLDAMQSSLEPDYRRRLERRLNKSNEESGRSGLFE